MGVWEKKDRSWQKQETAINFGVAGSDPDSREGRMEGVAIDGSWKTMGNFGTLGYSSATTGAYKR